VTPPFLLDTNTCIAYLRNRDPLVVQRMQARRPDEIRLCSVVQAELYYGAYHSPRPAANLALLAQFLPPLLSLPFDDVAAEIYGRVRADLAARGTPIGPNDLMIAAIALANHCTLVTHNTAEFSRVAGLPLDDWHIP
jgi:tRNA(fMet)-specific endonuclease VapC